MSKQSLSQTVHCPYCGCERTVYWYAGIVNAAIRVVCYACCYEYEVKIEGGVAYPAAKAAA